MNYSENKEKDNTTDHKEICGNNYTGAAIFPKVCVVHISCHTVYVRFVVFLDCCFAIMKDLCFEMFVRDGPVGKLAFRLFVYLCKLCTFKMTPSLCSGKFFRAGREPIIYCNTKHTAEFLCAHFFYFLAHNFTNPNPVQRMPGAFLLNKRFSSIVFPVLL